ncbi:alginate O-acetyltransferase AlgX-related protein [Microtetraspora malaysiensis]|uniref:alginate O-acetyltransferase AlgX-related protein n=1 Tax=Microtetraspora malaysiensis TaxID=161358 RepID=UPI00082A0190|nr:hypothetical protein [Microtetraspora malaysiensis]
MTSTDSTRRRENAGFRRVRGRRAAAVLAAGLLFFGPMVAFAAGERAIELENRRLPDFPDLAEGWAFIPKLESWAIAHLPLRQHAVSGNAALSQLLFQQPPTYHTGREPTYPRVIEGRDGWLYFGDDVAEACRPEWSIDETLDRVRRLARMVRKSGKRFLFTVAPDKTTIHPEHLPERFLGEDCLERRKREFWAALAQADLDGYIDLRSALLKLRNEAGKAVYWSTDSHWNDRSSALYGMLLAEAVQPGLTESSDLTRTGSQTRTGDLGPLLGTPREEIVEQWSLKREGVRQLRRDDSGTPLWFRVTNTSGKAPLFTPRTILIGDSFTRTSVPWTTPYFADLTVMRSDAPARAGARQVADQIAASDVVVFEMVERYFVGGHGEMLDDATLQAVEKALQEGAR